MFHRPNPPPAETRRIRASLAGLSGSGQGVALTPPPWVSLSSGVRAIYPQPENPGALGGLGLAGIVGLWWGSGSPAATTPVCARGTRQFFCWVKGGWGWTPIRPSSRQVGGLSTCPPVRVLRSPDSGGARRRVRACRAARQRARGTASLRRRSGIRSVRTLRGLGLRTLQEVGCNPVW